MVVLEPDEPGWGDDEDVEGVIPQSWCPRQRLALLPSQVNGRFVLGVDLGGVLLAKLPSGELPTVQTPNGVGVKMGYVPGAADWLADCVLNYGPENVYVVSLSLIHI